MDKLESYLMSLSLEEKLFIIYFLNMRLGRFQYALGVNLDILSWCPEDKQFEPLTVKKAKCSACQQAAQIRTIKAAAYEYRRAIKKAST